MATLIGLAIVLLLGVVIMGFGIGCLITDPKYAIAWITAIVIGLGSFVYSVYGIAVYKDASKTEIQIEVQHPSMNEGYNYCPYCGKEIE